MTYKRLKRKEKYIAVWLFIICALIFFMILLGGVTRLTQSGLSMVEWNPFMGIVPPLNNAEWREVFLEYKKFPEYQRINIGMTLVEFKRIFLFEYSHRLLGRFIGLAFALPFLYFLIRGHISFGLGIRLGLIFIAGAFQAVLGWYMVRSGLTQNPDVSPYRLTAHLGLAVLIYGYTFLTAVSLIQPKSNFVYIRAKNNLRLIIVGLTGLTFLTILSGGLVAGNDAGLAYNTFPFMDGKIVPEGVLSLDPWWSNYFENTILVQLNHRLLAILVVILTLITWSISFKYSIERGTRRALNIWAISVLAQLGLGLSTLLLFVPVHLAAAHQAGAIIVFTAALWCTSKVWRKGFK